MAKRKRKKRRVSAATKARLKALRRKHGLGEFQKKRRRTKRRSRTMPKRKVTRRRRTSAGLGGLGRNKFVKMAVAAGLGIAAGAGLQSLLNNAGQQFNIPQLQQFSDAGGAVGAYLSSGGGIPGAISAVSVLRSNNGGGGGSGRGAFI